MVCLQASPLISVVVSGNCRMFWQLCMYAQYLRMLRTNMVGSINGLHKNVVGHYQRTQHRFKTCTVVPENCTRRIGVINMCPCDDHE